MKGSVITWLKLGSKRIANEFMRVVKTAR